MTSPGKNSAQPSNSNSLGACDRCGKLVVLTRFTLCYDCRRLERIEMDKAFDYLKNHPGASLNAVADATGVNPDLVLKLIQLGRSESREKDLKEKIRKLNPDS